MSVISESVGRGDFSFARGTTFEWGTRWKRSTDNGRTFQPVDLTGWQLRMQLISPRDEIWLDIPAIQASANGTVRFRIDASDTAGDMWKARRSGTWKILASQPDGEILSATWENLQDASNSLLTTITDPDSGTIKLIAWGYWRCG